MIRKRIYANQASSEQGGSKRSKKVAYVTNKRLQKVLSTRLNYGFSDLGYVYNMNSTTASLQPINLIAEGTDDQQRVGNKVSMVTMELRVAISPGVTQTIAQRYSYYVILDKQPNGVATGFNSIFDTTFGAAGVFPNWATKDRFKILYQKHGIQNIVANNGYASSEFVDTQFLKINAQTNYNGPTATIGAVQTNALYIVAIGDGTVDDTAKPLMIVHARLVFTS